MRLSGWERRVGGALSGLRLDSITNKIVVLALLATLIPAVSTAVVSYVQNKSALTEKLDDELRNAAAQTARALDLWSKERQYDMRVFASSYEVSENLEGILSSGARAVDARARLTEYLSVVEQRFPDYTELLVTNPAATPVTSSAETTDESPLPEEWLERLRAGDAVLGDPYWDAERGHVGAVLAVPIYPPGQRFLGILAAKLDFNALETLLRQLAPGSSGRVHLVSEGGVIIASSVAGVARRLETQLDERTSAALDAAEGTPVEYTTTGSEAVVGTTAPVPRLLATAIVEIPTADAYAQVNRLRTVTIVMVLGLLFVVGAIAYLMGVLIVRPLTRLTEGAAGVAGGDLSVDVPVVGGGEVGYLTKVFNDMVGRLRRGREELDRANETLRTKNVELERLSITDVLTGLSNRRYLMQVFDEEIRRAERRQQPMCVLMLDVDRFKKYNDTHGHLAGDDVLRGLGEAIQQATRGIDTAARYGGEEFAVLLPECRLDGALEAAERMQARLAEAKFDGGAVTASMGVAEYPGHGTTPEALIAAADDALYEAKRRGRNRAVTADDVSPKTARATAASKKRASKARTTQAKKRKKAGD